MRVLVLGGTGAIGTSVVKILSERGCDVVVTSRKSHKSENNIHYCRGNAHDKEFLAGLLSEYWDVIIDFMVYQTDEFSNRVNFLLSATKQYVFLSSARVFAYSDIPITEASSRLLNVIDDEEFLSTREYSLEKALQEDVLAREGANWTIIRPYITYDDYRLQLGIMEKEDWLYRAMKGRSIVVSKELLSHFTTLTYGYDVADGIASLVGNDSALSRSFNITCGISVKWENVLQKYVEVLGRVLHRPIGVVMVDVDLGIEYGSKYQLIYDRFYDRTFDNANVLQYLPEKQFMPWEEGLERCLLKFVELPRFKSIHWGMEARRDRVSGEYTPLSEIPGIKNKIKYLICRFTKI